MNSSDVPSGTVDDRFSEVLALIHSARQRRNQGCVVLPGEICSVCANFTRLIGAMKKCQRC
ncbi:hypothetical protein D3C73_1588660 [compost metagenome]